MILVDTSVWIDHLRTGDEGLAAGLNGGQVLMHPFVLGELACGNIRNRSQIMGLLKQLPAVSVATDDEVLYYIERHGLMGRGIGYVDAHLLASVSLSDPAQIWTRDKRLHAVAEDLALAYQPST